MFVFLFIACLALFDFLAELNYQYGCASSQFLSKSSVSILNLIFLAVQAWRIVKSYRDLTSFTNVFLTPPIRSLYYRLKPLSAAGTRNLLII